MIIEIESAYGNALLHGKALTKRELTVIVKEILSAVSERDFTAVFCAQYSYEPITCSSPINADHTIDLDTHLVL